jgi:hypothetical protein
MRAVTLRLFALLLLAPPGAGCASLLRERVTPFPPGTPTKVPWQLNRELLQPVNRRILFVVDLAAGHPPVADALSDVARLAARYGERPASWEPAFSPAAPRTHWEGLHMSLEGPLRADTSYVFVRYVGEHIKHFGWSWAQRVGGRTLYFIVVNQERHRQWSGLIPERRLEEQTLVHEYGHLLGLPPCDHGYFARYPDFAEGAHCVNPSCALSKPRPRAVLYGLYNTIFRRRYLEDYCDECRRAIALAKRAWRGAVADARTAAEGIAQGAHP